MPLQKAPPLSGHLTVSTLTSPRGCTSALELSPNSASWCFCPTQPVPALSRSCHIWIPDTHPASLLPRGWMPHLSSSRRPREFSPVPTSVLLLPEHAGSLFSSLLDEGEGHRGVRWGGEGGETPCKRDWEVLGDWVCWWSPLCHLPVSDSWRLECVSFLFSGTLPNLKPITVPGTQQDLGNHISRAE